jgi:hypothetical protein
VGGGAARAHATLPWACTCSDQQQVAGLQEHQQRQCRGARRTGSLVVLCDVATMGRRWDGRRRCKSTHDVAIHSHAKHTACHVCTATQASHVPSGHGAVGGPCTRNGHMQVGWWGGRRGCRRTSDVITTGACMPRQPAGKLGMWLHRFCHGMCSDSLAAARIMLILQFGGGPRKSVHGMHAGTQASSHTLSMHGAVGHACGMGGGAAGAHETLFAMGGHMFR